MTADEVRAIVREEIGNTSARTLGVMRQGFSARGLHRSQNLGAPHGEVLDGAQVGPQPDSGVIGGLSVGEGVAELSQQVISSHTPDPAAEVASSAGDLA